MIPGCAARNSACTVFVTTITIASSPSFRRSSRRSASAAGRRGRSDDTDLLRSLAWIQPCRIFEAWKKLIEPGPGDVRLPLVFFVGLLALMLVVRGRRSWSLRATLGVLTVVTLVHLNFVGYVEGHDLFSDNIDVVVTDGFVGNIMLKSIESMGRAIVRLLRRELTANPLRKFGAALAGGALQSIKRRMDPEGYGGAPLLGLNGVVIKAHGSARERAFMNAIRVASETIQYKINDTILRETAQANEKLGLNKTAVPSPASAVA